MKSYLACLVVGALGATSAQAVVLGVDEGPAGYLAYMNVFELPSNGGAYVFGSPWGTNDLTSSFNNGAHTLTLGPNSINDPSPFWYTPAGGPGSTGNKVMEANLYHEVTGAYAGQVVQFKGKVLSNTFDQNHVARIFIRDFAPDYSSSVDTFINVTVGDFDISMLAINDAARHIQWGFQVKGPCVWITDIGPVGNAVIETIPAPASLGLVGFGMIAAGRRRRA